MADIVHTVEVAAKPDVIYPLVSSGPGFQAWWAEDVATLPGGVAELSFFDRTTIYRLRPLSLENGRRAEWQVETGEEWKGTRLVFELEARKSATLASLHPRGLGRRDRLFHRVQHDLGRADVPAEVRGGRKGAGAALPGSRARLLRV